MLRIMEPSRAFAVESFMILVVETTVSEFKSVTFRGALYFFFGCNCIEIAVWSDVIWGHKLTVVRTWSSCKPSAKDLSFAHDNLWSIEGKGCNRRIFFYLLRSNHRPISIIIGKGEVGFPYKIDYVVCAFSCQNDFNRSASTLACSRIFDVFYRAILGNKVGQRIVFRNHFSAFR